MATISPCKDFDVENDCKRLKGLFEDLAAKDGMHNASKQILMDILTTRSRYQRELIADTYESVYLTSMAKEIKSTLSGHFRDGILALVLPRAATDAERLYRSMKGLGTDEHTLREIICSRDSQELKAIAEAYVVMYKRELIADIRGDCSGQFSKLLCNLVNGSRGEGYVDPARSRQAAANLHRGASDFLDVLTTESFVQLNAIFMAFRRLKGDSIFTCLKNVHSGEVYKSLTFIAMFAICPAEFFGIMLHDKLEESKGTKSTLIDIILRRCDIDLYDIKQVYQYKTGIHLRDVVTQETKGELRSLLLLALK